MGKHPSGISLNFPQCDLESAIGQTLRASRTYEHRGDSDRAQKLALLAIQLSSLREPEVIAEFERRRARRTGAAA